MGECGIGFLCKPWLESITGHGFSDVPLRVCTFSDLPQEYTTHAILKLCNDLGYVLKFFEGTILIQSAEPVQPL
jgi:hypothetical protein